MDKAVAVTILEDIQKSLLGSNGKENGLRTVEIYKKNLEVSTNKKIKELMDKQKKYGTSGRKALKLNKKIDEEIKKIYNS